MTTRDRAALALRILTGRITAETIDPQDYEALGYVLSLWGDKRPPFDDVRAYAEEIILDLIVPREAGEAL